MTKQKQKKMPDFFYQAPYGKEQKGITYIIYNLFLNKVILSQ